MSTCRSSTMTENALELWPNRLVGRLQLPHELTTLHDALVGDVVVRFNAIGVTETEVALMRAVVLLNDSTTGLVDACAVTDVRDRYYTCLYEHVATPPSNRLSHLLLRLPTLRSLVVEQTAAVRAFVPAPPSAQYLGTYLRLHGAHVCDNNNGMADRQMA